jgi:hypothetical protein
MKLEGLMFILCPKNWSNSQFSCHRMIVRALPFILCPKLQKTPLNGKRPWIMA